MPMTDPEENQESSNAEGKNRGESVSSASQLLLTDHFIGYELEGRYKLIELIGTGGWGNVYRGKHLTLGTDIAVKVIHKHLWQDDKSLKRFEQEAILLSKLESPHIVRIIDFGMSPAPYIVMEYFDGIPLNKWLKENGAMRYDTALEIFVQICDGLNSAQSLGLVHRDLKPGNLLIRLGANKIEAKILDFGLAKLVNESSKQESLTATGEVLGSPPYMSPEQWTGMADHRSDIYSLGCIMYEALSGNPAFVAQYGIDYLNKHVSTRPPRIREVIGDDKFPSTLDDIVQKCLQKAPENRYANSIALRDDLKLVKGGRRIHVRLAEQGEIKKSVHPAVPALLIAGTCLLILAASLIWQKQAMLFLAEGLEHLAQSIRPSSKNDNKPEQERKTIDTHANIPVETPLVVATGSAPNTAKQAKAAEKISNQLPAFSIKPALQTSALQSHTVNPIVRQKPVAANPLPIVKAPQELATKALSSKPSTPPPKRTMPVGVREGGDEDYGARRGRRPGMPPLLPPPQQLRFLQSIGKGQSTEAGKCYFVMGQNSYGRGNFATSEACFEQAIAIWKKSAPASSDIALALDHLHKAKIAQGKK